MLLIRPKFWWLSKMIIDQYERLRLDRISSAKILGDYYRLLSLSFNSGHDECPLIRPIDLLSVHGRNLLNRACNQSNGNLKKNKDGFITICCNYCNKTFIINEIDQHERECEEHD